MRCDITHGAFMAGAPSRTADFAGYADHTRHAGGTWPAAHSERDAELNLIGARRHEVRAAER
jgi:hypothetical protein